MIVREYAHPAGTILTITELVATDTAGQDKRMNDALNPYTAGREVENSRFRTVQAWTNERNVVVHESVTWTARVKAKSEENE